MSGRGGFVRHTNNEMRQTGRWIQELPSPRLTRNGEQSGFHYAASPFRTGRRRAVVTFLDAKLEGAPGDNRPSGHVRLRLHARKSQAAGSLTATYRRASKRTGGSESRVR